MSVKLGEQQVDEKVRDKVFSELKGVNGNNICLDCEIKNPKWASIHLGIHLCLDCAGRHRQYGVHISFIKSTNLDAWNQKQLLYMQKGGNNRCLQFLRKRGLITPNNRTIDYKSPILQQYKQMLSDEVQIQLVGGKKEQKVEENKAAKSFFDQLETKEQEKKIQIPKAEEVEENTTKPKGKKTKKKIGAKQINIDDFQSLAFDGGVSTEERQKIVKEYEKQKDVPVITQSFGAETVQVQVVPKIQQPKELSEEEIKKKMQELKQQTNLKNISSQSFKDNNIDNVTLKQNLNKFSGASSISSSAFFDKEEEQPNATMQNLKGMVSNVGQKLFGKLAGYWGK